MDKLTITKLNEVYIKVQCEPSIAMELSTYFTFDVPGAKFMPSYRNKLWDGKIKLYNTLTQTLYVGLLRYVEEFCKARNYEIDYNSDFSSEEFSLHEAKQFLKTLNLPFEPREYQLDAFVHAIRERRSLLLSPTASGKSFIIYLITRYYDKRTLIIVPTTALVSQLASDFSDYGFDSNSNVHGIFAGKDKQTDKQITISTWQSVYKLPKEYFEQFDVVIGDEAHLFKAKSLISIMSNLEKCVYRFGFTGTLDGTQTNKLVLEGLFGPVRKVTTTSKLMEDKHLADLSIKAIVLNYPEEIRKMISRSSDYQSEMDYLVSCKERNNFIKNLTLSLEGNTLLLFQYVDKHGKVLEDLIRNEANGRDVYFVHGGVDGSERDIIRKNIDNNMEKIIFEFGANKITCNINDEVLLTNGIIKKASEISEEDDISDEWIMKKFRKENI